MSTSYFPNLTARVHMAVLNAGTAELSTREVAERVGVPRGDGGFASSLVWRELDMLARRGEVERIVRPDSKYRYWRRATAQVDAQQCPHTPACPPSSAADAQRARVVDDHAEQGWSRLCNGVVIIDHEPLTGPIPAVTPWSTYRVQRRRTAGWRMPEGAVYVGRPTKFGNPFPVAEYGPAGAVEQYRLWLQTQPDLVDAARAELRGRNLACWCPPGRPCHADVLLPLARQFGPTTPGATR